MNVYINITLKDSAIITSPESIKSMVKNRMDEIIKDDPVIGLFVGGYAVEVRS